MIIYDYHLEICFIGGSSHELGPNCGMIIASAPEDLMSFDVEQRVGPSLGSQAGLITVTANKIQGL